MKWYLSSPGNQMVAHACSGQPVLLSFATWKPWQADYAQTYSSVLIDSGAFSALKGPPISVEAYADWLPQWDLPFVAARAGLDSIIGDHKQSWANYQRIPAGFPTIHDSDPPEFLEDLVALASERTGWIGIGLNPNPTRYGKRPFVERTIQRIRELDPTLHIHGWALGIYDVDCDSKDSTHYFRDAMKLRSRMQWLSLAECVEIMVKKYERAEKKVSRPSTQEELF